MKRPSTAATHPARLGTFTLFVLLFATCMVSLQGCATRPLLIALPDAAADSRSLMTSFELIGRLSASDGTDAAHGQLHWERAPDRETWTVSTPLGQIVAKLTRSNTGALLVFADGRHLEAADAAEMLPAVLGVEAPLEALPSWVQAVPRKGAQVLQVDASGRPLRVADAGWIIDYAEYAGPGPDALPRRLEANRGDARIRLIIDEWNRLP